MKTVPSLTGLTTVLKTDKNVVIGVVVAAVIVVLLGVLFMLWYRKRYEICTDMDSINILGFCRRKMKAQEKGFHLRLRDFVCFSFSFI